MAAGDCERGVGLGGRQTELEREAGVSPVDSGAGLAASRRV